ncbi:MAG: DHH family phosphoesterase [Planctomycetales bacterium]
MNDLLRLLLYLVDRSIDSVRRADILVCPSGRLESLRRFDTAFRVWCNAPALCVRGAHARRAGGVENPAGRRPRAWGTIRVGEFTAISRERMARNWRFSPYDEAEVRRLCRELQVSPLMSQVLLARGLCVAAEADRFLNATLRDLCDPELLPGVSEAADRIVAALRAGRRITIYGDYDVDGMTATSLLWHCLKLEHAQVDYYIPQRLEEGYGLNCDAIRQLHEEDPRRLVVTVDCGIASVKEAALARELGLELIITDHHNFGATLPEAACIVHPALRESHESRVTSDESAECGVGSAEFSGDSAFRTPHSELRIPNSSLVTRNSSLPCGAGVAFKLAWAICKRLGDGKNASPRMREFLKSAVGLAAIGTVADVVPLRDENRVIVRYGLAALATNAGQGLKALLRVARIEEDRVLQAEDVAFGIAPRLNAAGRLGQARLAVELLTTDKPDRALALAQYLEELNRNRQTVERKIFKQAKELVAAQERWANDPALVLAHPEWHAGVIGIVANRVAEHFEKPAVLIALDAQKRLGQGSGRSFGGFDLHAALCACAEHLASFGGHRAAAGLRIAGDGVDHFREAFCAYATQFHRPAQDAGDLRIDAEVRLADVTAPAVKELDRLGPFGHENPRPVFVSTGVELAEPPRTMGEGDRHLQIRVRQNGSAPVRAIAFGKGEWAEELQQAGPRIAISFAANINAFRGFERVELQLKDWQPG